ncbi:hypothetical protein [Granulicatella sp. 19428wC4_WM01]|nr:hypothetical protein [Granulicatella sp. 19428wC4_WM01]TFU95368.1 hypothetical protein E4T68_05110 [Granulicatella sp. WM01]
MAFCVGNSILPVTVNAESTNIAVKDISCKDQDLIKVVDEHIVETMTSYQIIKPDELKEKIGVDNFNKLQTRLVIANKEKSESLNREAVQDIHIQILRQVGATVESHWWGKRIITHNRDTAINVRKLANAFTGTAGDAGIVSAMAAAGIGIIPGLGTPAAIAGIITGVISWADSTTWNNVATQVANNIDSGKYNLTIGINAWIMEVKVY